MSGHVDADLGDLASLFPEKPVEFRAKSPYRRSSVEAFGYVDSDLDTQSRLRLAYKHVPTEVTPDGAAAEDAALDKEVREKPQPRERASSPHGRRGPIAIEFDEQHPEDPTPPPHRPLPLPPPLPATTSSFVAALRALSPSGTDQGEHQHRAMPAAAGPKARNAQALPDFSQEAVDDSFIGGYRDKHSAAAAATAPPGRHDRRSVTASRATRVSFAGEDAVAATAADDDAQSHASSHGPAALQRWKEEAERLRRENEKLKQDVLLTANAAKAAPPAAPSSSAGGSTRQRRRAASPHGAQHQRTAPEEGSGDSAAGPLRPQKGPLLPARAVAHTHVPHTHTMQPLQRNHPPNPGQGPGPGPGPHAQLIHQLQQLQFTAQDGTAVVCLPKLLWEGGFVWKIPFNGRGAPERRLVAVKRASHASIYSRAVRVIPPGASQVRPHRQGTPR